MPEVGHGGNGRDGGTERIVIGGGGGGVQWAPLSRPPQYIGPTFGVADCFDGQRRAMVRGTRMFEFGNAITSTALPGSAGMPALRELALEQGQEALAFTAVLYDIEWVDPLRVVEGPIVDNLRRFSTVGWYARFRSHTYETLVGHFERRFQCVRRHEPDELTREYAGDVFHRLLEAEKRAEYERGRRDGLDTSRHWAGDNEEDTHDE